MRAKTRSPVPLEVDRRGHSINIHGIGGYHRGCGCPVCTEAHVKENQERDSSGDPIHTHGLSGWARGHRCEVCVAAYEEDKAARRDAAGPVIRKLPDGQVRKPRGTWLSDPELALVDEAAAATGLARSTYMREAVLMAAADDLNMTDAELAALDTARRPAPRQPNRQQREDATG